MYKRPRGRVALVAVPALLCALVGVSSAGAATFTNSAPITIPTLGAASPYGSEISVSGVPAPITDVNVRVNGFSHDSPNDIGFVLVAPGGLALMLGNGVGDNVNPAENVNFGIDDSAPSLLPDSGILASGTYRPMNQYASNFDPPGPGTAYGNPGPFSGGTATLASIFNGQAANGVWNLFVRDFVNNPSGGQFASGWGLEISPDPLTATTPLPLAGSPTPTGTNKKKCKKKKRSAAAAKKKKCKKKKKR